MTPHSHRLRLSEARQADTHRRAEELRTHVQRYRSNAAQMQRRHLLSIERRERSAPSMRTRNTPHSDHTTRGETTRSIPLTKVRSPSSEPQPSATLSASVLDDLLSGKRAASSSTALAAFSTFLPAAQGASQGSVTEVDSSTASALDRAHLQKQHQHKLIQAACTELEHRCQQTWRDIQQLQFELEEAANLEGAQQKRRRLDEQADTEMERILTNKCMALEAELERLQQPLLIEEELRPHDATIQRDQSIESLDEQQRGIDTALLHIQAECDLLENQVVTLNQQIMYQQGEGGE
mmetsp:Transcript_316/g.935  ORF Transcript_316/g.935 Transcript_316/m.935 type:complete len:294 (-) Transcript_316:4-885(-)